MRSSFFLSEDIGRQDGFALLTVLFFSLIITISALAYFQLGNLEVGFFYTDKRYWKALYAADAGREKLGWLLKRSTEIRAYPDREINPGREINPFNENVYPYPYYPDRLYDPDRSKLTDILFLANPANSNEPFFPTGESNTPYYRVVDVWGEGSKVYYRIMGSVDTDGDGISGLSSDYGGEYDFKNRDEQDVNRYFEGYVILPGSLGQEISAGARHFYDGDVEALLSESAKTFITDRGEGLSGFRYHEADSNNSDFYRYVFSRPILRSDAGPDDVDGDLLLPRGLFNAQTGAVNASYFSGLTMKQYEGAQTFGRFSDPTDDIVASRKAIIFVNGDVTIEQVDFGYFTEGGSLRGNDWSHTDVVILSTGNLTVRGVDCGMVGRLILIAKNIYLEGNWGSVINGIAIASNDIYLQSTASNDSVKWVKTSSSQPAYWSAYFYGTILAGNTIHLDDGNLDDGGWSVIYDKNVINGSMFNLATYLYDRGEQGTTSCWYNVTGTETEAKLKFSTGHYLQDEINNNAGDSQDPGGSTPQEVLRVANQPDITNMWEGVGESIRFKLEQCGKDGNANFDDWSKYNGISFYMALDNYSYSAEGSEKETWKEAEFAFGLRDADGNEVNFDLTGEKYPKLTSWGKRPYFYDGSDDIQDKNPSNDNYSNGDLPIWIRVDLHFSEIVNPATETFNFSKVSEFFFEFTNITPIVEDDLRTTLRLDRIELPGAQTMNYGLPSSFRYGVSRWREISENEAMQ